MKNNKPPKLAELLLKLFLSKEEYSEKLGDLHEGFNFRKLEKKYFKSYIWYWKQVLLEIPKSIKDTTIRSFAMVKNYLKVALRTFKRYKGYSIINIAGLSIGIASAILILLWVNFETSYDKHQKNADRIYRVIYESTGQTFAFTSAPMAKVLVNSYPEIVNAVRISNWEEALVTYKDKHITESNILFADSTIFQIFTIPFIKGNPETALDDPYTIVLTEEMADKYFGEDDAINKMIQIDEDTDNLYRITGIVKKAPNNSHFSYNFIASLSSIELGRADFWGNNSLYTYVLLQKGIRPSRLESKFPQMIKTHVGPQIEELLGLSFESYMTSGKKWNYFLQPIKDIHLHSHYEFEFEPNGRILYVYIFTVLAFFIILIACINFMNLSTAYSANRAKEVGVRKVLGSNSGKLRIQFLFESFFSGIISFFIAVIMVMISLPSFNELAGRDIQITLSNTVSLFPVFIGIVIFIGLFAGSYPTFVLSKFNPASVLKGNLRKGAKRGGLRNFLVIFQFSISFIILVCTLVVHNQLYYLQNKNLGFDKERVLVNYRPFPLGDREKPFKQELLKSPGILSVSYSTSIPGETFSQNTHYLEGESRSEGKIAYCVWADYDFAKTLDLKIKSGRYFSEQISSDTTGIVINEKAVKTFGLIDPIGKRLVGTYRDFPQRLVSKKIIGIVEDFHFESLHDPIKPFIIEFIPENWGFLTLIKIKPGNIEETIKHIEDISKKFTPDQPFNFTFLDDNFNEQYETEQRTEKIFTVFSILAVFIACLGLYGLISFIAQQKTKEIGIRKVIGASEPEIIIMLIREIVFLVVVSILISVPIAVYFTKNWLSNFAYRTEISTITFVLTAVFTVLIACITVSYQAVKAAWTKPVNALKYE